MQLRQLIVLRDLLRSGYLIDKVCIVDEKLHFQIQRIDSTTQYVVDKDGDVYKNNLVKIGNFRMWQ